MVGRIVSLNRSRGGVPKLAVTLQIGGLKIDITAYAWPCKKIGGAFLDENPNRISEKLYPGWSRVYARVTGNSILRVSDEVRLI